MFVMLRATETEGTPQLLEGDVYQFVVKDYADKLTLEVDPEGNGNWVSLDASDNPHHLAGVSFALKNHVVVTLGGRMRYRVKAQTAGATVYVSRCD